MGRREWTLSLAGEPLIADAAGVLIVPAAGLLVVADLHLEKGSAFAARGRGILPPYDTADTLARLGLAIRRHQPRVVLCLGDSFHDTRAGERLAAADRATLFALADGRDWIWAEGNHDSVLPPGLPGRSVADWSHGPLVFRHQAANSVPDGRAEISGHFHPKTTISTAARAIRRPCFVHDGRRMLLPAFGAYTGGLDIGESAIANLFDSPPIRLVLGRDAIHPFPPVHRIASNR